MDTKSKKFNSTIITKTIAVLLCIVCFAGCVNQALTSIFAVDRADLYDRAFEDAFVYGGKRLDKIDVTDTKTFKHYFESYGDLIAHMVGNYGNGTAEDYETYVKRVKESNEFQKKFYKQNIINHVIRDYFSTYLDLVEDGIVEPLGFIQAAEYSGEDRDFEVESIGSEVDYYNLCLNSVSMHDLTPVPEEVQEKANELKADGVFEINNYYKVIDYDYEYDYETVIETYKPGYYAFRINEEILWDTLYRLNIMEVNGYYSAEDFKEAYDVYANNIAENYPTGRYFIKDDSGRVFTNIEGITEKSSTADIEKALDEAGFYVKDDGYGDFVLPDGSYYKNSPFYNAAYYDGDYEYVATTMYEYYGTTLPAAETTTLPDASAPTVETTTTLPATENTTVASAEATKAQNENVTTTGTVTEPADSDAVPATTAPVAASSVVKYNHTMGVTPFINENSDNFICYMGVDMKTDEFPETDVFRTTVGQIETARNIMLEFAYIFGAFALAFIVCFIYLVIRSGRRRGSDEVHFMKGDNMFVDLRIILDCALGWGVFLLLVLAVEWFQINEEQEALFNNIITVIAVAFSVLVLDLVLFVTRHIKARTLLKRLSVVWLIRKVYKVCKEKTEKIKPYIETKFLYTKEFGKGTLVRLAGVVVINLLLVCAVTFESASNGTILTLVPLIIFNVFVIVWVIRFVGGMHKIFSALDEIRQGNYDVQINIYALPSTLRETAQKVMSLRDGLKTAVDEAVKQEQTKTELITNVSHDLKTPLTSIINYVELLKKCDIDDEDAKEYLAVLGEKSDRLKKLIEDLVEASKASTGNVNVEFVEVSLNEMVSQLLGEHADTLEKRKLNIVADIPEENLTVCADGKLLYRVMENLIVNVEKYSLYGTRVYVTVRREGDYGTVTFKNISEQALNISAEQLMERFVRGDESRSTEGNGLGLSIAKSLCELQNGELELTINGDLFTAKVKLGR